MRNALPLAVGGVAAALAFGGVMVLSDDDERPPGQPAPAERIAVGTSGHAVFNRMGCGGCHRLAAANSSAEIGPPLDDRLQSHSAESLRAVILNPPAGSIMPRDFRARMSDAELDSLVAFLLDARR